MICKNCNNEIDDKAVICVKCGTSAIRDKTDSLSRALLPVGRSGYAITAGYLGLFSVLVLPAPFALIYGIMGYSDIKKNPHKHGMGRVWLGIIMGSIGTAILMWFIFMILTR